MSKGKGKATEHDVQSGEWQDSQQEHTARAEADAAGQSIVYLKATIPRIFIVAFRTLGKQWQRRH